jgi:hypothetical protein
MKTVRWLRAARVLVPSAMLFQFTACLGPDPQLFLTTSAANALLVNLITLVFNTVFGGAVAVAG